MAKINLNKQRDKLQIEIYKSWVDNDRQGLIIGGTGIGKGRIGIMSVDDQLKEKPSARIMIFAPTHVIINTWKDEFRKWGLEKYIERITFNCYNSSVKFVGEEFDLVIADEFHCALTPVYSKFFLENKINRLLCLTATIDGKEKEKLLSKITKVIYTKPSDAAAEEGLVNEVQHIAIYYDLDERKNIKVANSKGGLYVSEKDNYNLYDKMFKKAKGDLFDLGYTSLGKNAFFLVKNHRIPVGHKQILYRYITSMRKRKDILLLSDTSARISKFLSSELKREKSEIKKIINIQPEKILIFAELTDQIKKITENCVHSKQSEKTNKEVIGSFNNGEIDILGSCKSLTMGVNLTGANVAIYDSYFSSKTNAQQRAGRSRRIATDQKACNIYLVAKDTQMEEWFNNMISWTDREIAKYEIKGLKIKKYD